MQDKVGVRIELSQKTLIDCAESQLWSQGVDPTKDDNVEFDLETAVVHIGDGVVSVTINMKDIE